MQEIERDMYKIMNAEVIIISLKLSSSEKFKLN